MGFDAIPVRLFATAARRADQPAYFERIGGSWTPTVWSDYAAQVRQAARALLALGITKGDRVCILGFNRPEWVVLDLAAMCIGAVPAGIYTTCSPDEVAYIVGHAKAKLVLIEDAGQWAKIEAGRDRLPSLAHVVTMRVSEPIDDPMVMSWEAFLAQAEPVDDARIDDTLDALQPDDLGTLIYTSGTTGPPKAVMLTHRNLAWTASTAVDLVHASGDERSVSYLPLSHIAEQMFSIHSPVTAGWPIYFARSLQKLPDDIREVRPTVMFGVPRIWEKFHAKVSAKLADATGPKALLASWALKTGLANTQAINHGQQGGGLRYRLADKLVLSKIRDAMGLSEARMCVTGAAPIATEVLHFFASVGITIHEVYGQSEGSGPTSFNPLGAAHFGTVGPPLIGTEVKIAEDGEIVVRGPHVFAGYLGDDAATAETLVDGWLQTGDLGAFDDDGYLCITGRKKDILITAGGKNIAPKNLEEALRNCPLVAQAIVIGDRRKFLSALLTLDPEAIEAWQAEHGVVEGPVHEAAGVVAVLQSWVDDQVNPQFARVEHIRKFAVLPRDFSIDDGELTPTLKLKRKPIAANWSDTIEGMYTGA